MRRKVQRALLRQFPLSLYIITRSVREREREICNANEARLYAYIIPAAPPLLCHVGASIKLAERRRWIDNFLHNARQRWIFSPSLLQGEINKKKSIRGALLYLTCVHNGEPQTWAYVRTATSAKVPKQHASQIDDRRKKFGRTRAYKMFHSLTRARGLHFSWMRTLKVYKTMCKKVLKGVLFKSWYSKQADFRL